MDNLTQKLKKKIKDLLTYVCQVSVLPSVILSNCCVILSATKQTFEYQKKMQ